MSYALDLETSPVKKTDNPYALEPYRAITGEAYITSVCVAGGYSDPVYLEFDSPQHLPIQVELNQLLTALEGKTVYCHNAVFDVAWLLAYCDIEIMRKITWKDTATLNKYLVNGQKADEKKISYSLVNCVDRALKGHPLLEEFDQIKAQDVKPGENPEYWKRRNILDTLLTLKLAEKLETYMTPTMQVGYDVVSASILPIAQGWLAGIPIDMPQLVRYEKELKTEGDKILKTLNVSGEVLRSPKQLANLLFDQYGLTPVSFTPTGAPSTSAENLLRLEQKYPDEKRLKLILEYKKTATMTSKYVKGLKNSIDYIGMPSIHGAPRILSTITGRMTYNSKIFKKYQTSIALHQLPRKDKGTKRCLIPPVGYKILYMDISAQEGRIMAIQAPEPRMIESYNKGIDLHSDLTSDIFGTPYEKIVQANKDGEPSKIVEQRQAGKLTGLSSFYRIGAQSLANKFFTTYGYDVSREHATHFLNSFKRKYPGVVKYWNKSIGLARRTGYAEAFGGWRYRIYNLDWKGESSAINHPIQGSGAMQTYATIGAIAKKWPQLIMVAQVHDSLTYFIPEEDYLEVARDVKDVMNKFDYGKVLNFDQTVPITLDVAVGDNFADLETI